MPANRRYKRIAKLLQTLQPTKIPAELEQQVLMYRWVRKQCPDQNRGPFETLGLLFRHRHRLGELMARCLRQVDRCMGLREGSGVIDGGQGHTLYMKSFSVFSFKLSVPAPHPFGGIFVVTSPEHPLATRYFYTRTGAASYARYLRGECDRPHNSAGMPWGMLFVAAVETENSPAKR